MTPSEMPSAGPSVSVSPSGASNSTLSPEPSSTPVPSGQPQSSSPTAGGGPAEPLIAVFDELLGAPRCVPVGISCDTNDLIDGRGTMRNGNEPNRPNT